MEKQYVSHLVTLDFFELQTYTCEFQLKDQIPEFFRNTEILNKVKTKTETLTSTPKGKMPVCNQEYLQLL